MVYFVEGHGQQYPQGMPVRIDRSSGRPEVVPDPNGDQEIHSCKPQRHTGGGTAVLAIETRPRRETFDMPARHDPQEDLEIDMRVRKMQVEGDFPTLGEHRDWAYTIIAINRHPTKHDWRRYTLLPRA